MGVEGRTLISRVYGCGGKDVDQPGVWEGGEDVDQPGGWEGGVDVDQPGGWVWREGR